jgi:hypothetical protein
MGFSYLILGHKYIFVRKQAFDGRRENCSHAWQAAVASAFDDGALLFAAGKNSKVGII